MSAADKKYKTLVNSRKILQGNYEKCNNDLAVCNDKQQIIVADNEYTSTISPTYVSKPKDDVKKISLSDFKFDSSDMVVRQVSGGFEVERIGTRRHSTLVIANKVYEYSVEFLSGDENDNYWVTLHRNFFQTYV